MRMPAVACITIGAAVLCGCSHRDRERLRQTTTPTYDSTSGKLTQLTYDRNGNGVVDTWVDMDGNKPLRSRSDTDEDGKVDRWEYYDNQGRLLKVGYSRKNGGKPDAWAFSDADGQVARIEISSIADERKIDRSEYYVKGVLVRAEQDTDRDGRPDTWETYENGTLKTAAFDEDRDGRPDRRLTYSGDRVTLLESEPDASGNYRTRKMPETP